MTVRQSSVTARIDRAFHAFFRRCRSGQTPGFPRFRGRGRFQTLVFGTRRSHFGWHGTGRGDRTEPRQADPEPHPSRRGAARRGAGSFPPPVDASIPLRLILRPPRCRWASFPWMSIGRELGHAARRVRREVPCGPRARGWPPVTPQRSGGSWSRSWQCLR